MDAEDAVGLGVGEDLDEAVGVGVAAGAGIGGERKLADPVVDAVVLELLLGRAHRRHLGPSVDHTGDRLVVDVPGLSGEQLGDGHALVLGLVGEHLAADDVADGEDAGNVGLELAVDRDEAAVVDLDADRLQPQTLGVGPPADGNQHHVHLQGLGVAALHRLDGQGDAGVGLRGAGDLARQLERQPLFLEGAQHLLGHLRVHAGEDLVEELDHRHLGAEPTPHRSELDADVAAADHHHRLRHLGQRQRAGRADDPLLVDVDPRQGRHVGAGGDQDVPGLQHPAVAAVGRRHRDLAGGGDRSRPDQVVDLVFLQQELDPLGEIADDPFLALHHRRQVDLQAGDLDPVVGELLRRDRVVVRGLQQRLRRNAADVEAGAAERAPLLDAGDAKPQLRGADRRHVAARPAADDNEIICAVGHHAVPVRC